MKSSNAASPKSAFVRPSFVSHIQLMLIYRPP